MASKDPCDPPASLGAESGWGLQATSPFCGWATEPWSWGFSFWSLVAGPALWPPSRVQHGSRTPHACWEEQQLLKAPRFPSLGPALCAERSLLRSHLLGRRAVSGRRLGTKPGPLGSV